MDPRIKELRLQRWKEIIVACNTSGMKKKDWMAIHHVNSKTFYCMQKKIRETELDKMEIPMSDSEGSTFPSRFVDMTSMLSHPESSTPLDAVQSASSERVLPEIMLQAGPYQLYIGKGITEATLATVLKVIRNA